MKEFLTRPGNIRRVELWLVAGISVLSIAEGIFSGFFNIDYFLFKLMRTMLVVAAFLLINFFIVPRIERGENQWLNNFFLLVIFLTIGFLFTLTGHEFMRRTEPHSYNTFTAVFQNPFLQAYFVMLLFGFYFALKYAILYLFISPESVEPKYKTITQDGLISSVVCAISILFLIVVDAEPEVILAWAVMSPFAIALYSYSFYSAIPLSLRRKRPFLNYLFRVIAVLVVTYFPVSILFLLFTSEEEVAFSFGFLNAFFQLLIITPLSWLLFKRHAKGEEELFSLKKELGQTHASFDFLRSQINPHFLFNALNTIYGMAIQEKAERTREGIEKLGDMMRFMLHENVQDKISLIRETEYLNNYIAFQKLRTDQNPTIRIETSIEQTFSSMQIAPMLLIPFVENAFKHGISFRDPSHIRVTLEVKDTTVHFDVNNSKHTRPENDPEKDKSGVGLENVKQRLQLLYPSKHQLIIHETGKEFFIHLTIQLS